MTQPFLKDPPRYDPLFHCIGAFALFGSIIFILVMSAGHI